MWHRAPALALLAAQDGQRPMPGPPGCHQQAEARPQDPSPAVTATAHRQHSWMYACTTYLHQGADSKQRQCFTPLHLHSRVARHSGTAGIGVGSSRVRWQQQVASYTSSHASGSPCLVNKVAVSKQRHCLKTLLLQGIMVRHRVSQQQSTYRTVGYIIVSSAWSTRLPSRLAASRGTAPTPLSCSHRFNHSNRARKIHFRCQCYVLGSPGYHQQAAALPQGPSPARHQVNRSNSARTEQLDASATCLGHQQAAALPQDPSPAVTD
jgi:hypothetical protein